jgi:hypothetical protein
MIRLFLQSWNSARLVSTDAVEGVVNGRWPFFVLVVEAAHNQQDEKSHLQRNSTPPQMVAQSGGEETQALMRFDVGGCSLLEAACLVAANLACLRYLEFCCLFRIVLVI